MGTTYEELEQVFYHFSKDHMKILLRDINAKLGREDIFKRKLGIGLYTNVIMIMVLE